MFWFLLFSLVLTFSISPPADATNLHVINIHNNQSFTYPEHPVESKVFSLNQIYLPTCPILLPQHPPKQSPVPSSEPIPTITPISSIGFTSTREKRSLSTLSAPQTNYTSSTLAHIVGGLEINSTLSNYIALLVIDSVTLQQLCTASIVAQDILFTAAHCVLTEEGTLIDDLAVVFGAARGASGRGGIINGVKSVFFHPQYVANDSSTFIHDVAWIQLLTPAPTFARFMKVNSNASLPLNNSVVRAAGYGIHYFSNNNRFPDTQLYQVDFPVANVDYCDLVWNKFNTFDNAFQFCAGYQFGGCSICFGDSGGPLIQYDEENEPVLIGVTAAGIRCGTQGEPSLFSRVSSYLSTFLPSENVTLTGSTNPIFLSGPKLKDPFATPTPSASKSPSTTPSPSLLPASPALSSSNATMENSGDSDDIDRTLLIVLFAMVGGILIGVIIIALILFYVRNKPRQNSMQPTQV